MMLDFQLVLIVLMAFTAVAGLIFVAAQYYINRSQVKRRLSAGAVSAEVVEEQSRSAIGNLIKERFTEESFGVDSSVRSKLRRQLLRSGYFNHDALNYYFFARIATVIVLPIAIFVIMNIFLPTISRPLLLLAVSVGALIGIFGPDAFLSNRQGSLSLEYRRVFPDLLDLLVVCVNSGLSIEGALQRVRPQIEMRSQALGINLEIMGAETRAGRSTIEALHSLADRLAIDEAAALVSVLRHSIELGGNVAEALTVFSDELRDKRMFRAEETANKLSVKMVIPLALFIFPVILMIVMLPIALKLAFVFAK